ncbi:hypothetical protein JY651_26345 [Pyxidicoccus parkwayensis]|uniref:Uncharacterized protein n=1 Tax=Pyxidicoccus parkwayensis TaxID=2813578 RepID=A0ABX7NKG0_9BACT|nr:hypothetical protein [Pyxidicoccus parkwaysis]QSQ18879.1 hypothetical protein JY651_26345 [Pyxidicoccus parkwaysis]
MPVAPDDLPEELRELAPAITIRMVRGGGRRPVPPPGVPKDSPPSWVELTFEPQSPALPELVRARLAAALGNTHFVWILEYDARSQTDNREDAIERLKTLLGPFLASGR